MDVEGDRIRVVIMGDNRVGKSAILERLLKNTFQASYRPTVEDLYSKDFQIGDSTLKVDFLDTSGDDQFPVMRRLSISSGNAFLLVYSITCPSSMQTVHNRLEEIKQQRKDFKDVPIVIAGNKVDLADEGREIFVEDVKDWVDQQYKQNRMKVLECSALNTYNIGQLFRTFLTLSRIDLDIMTRNERPAAEKKLQRGKSAYAKMRSFGSKSKPSLEDDKRITPRLSLKYPSSPKLDKLRFRMSKESAEDDLPISYPDSHGFSTSSSPLSDQSTQGSPSYQQSSPVFDFNTTRILKEHHLSGTKAEAAFSGYDVAKSKPRSRSLIRRSSKKVKKKICEVNSSEDCVIN